jgi:hypothetical protein
MDINENEINESNDRLDSFIYLEEKKLIENKNLLARLNEIKFTEVIQKRSGMKLTVADLDSFEYLLPTFDYIGSASISQNIEIIKTIEELKIDTLIDWFTNAAVIRNEFVKINSSNDFRILPFEAFDVIFCLNKCKILLLLSNHFWPNWNNSYGNLMLDSLINLEETKKNRERKGKFPYTDNVEKEIDEKLAKLKSDLKIRNINKNYKDLLKGNIDGDIIREIFNQINGIQKSSTRMKKLLLFPLIKLILKDKHHMTEQEFDKSKSQLMNYEEYMISVVSNLLNLK